MDVVFLMQSRGAAFRRVCQTRLYSLLIMRIVFIMSILSYCITLQVMYTRSKLLLFPGQPREIF